MFQWVLFPSGCPNADLAYIVVMIKIRASTTVSLRCHQLGLIPAAFAALRLCFSCHEPALVPMQAIRSAVVPLSARLTALGPPPSWANCWVPSGRPTALVPHRPKKYKAIVPMQLYIRHQTVRSGTTAHMVWVVSRTEPGVSIHRRRSFR
jgi:hypothetical protein